MGEHRAIMFDCVDGSKAFTVASVPIAEPVGDEVRFKVSAFALNQADLLLTEDLHLVLSTLPIRLGYEGSGVVDAVGPDVTIFKPGDRVTCIPNVDGPYWTAGEYALARQAYLTPWPDDWSAPEAASLWMQYLTPYFPFVELFPFEPGAWVMITAASGGTGLGSVRMAKLLGARIIATTRTQCKVLLLKDAGADLVLSTEGSNFVDQVMEATDGAGVRLLCDSLCGHYVANLSRTLAERGIMYIHGALSGDNSFSLPILNLVHRQAGIHGYSLINELRRPGSLTRARDFILNALEKGSLPKPTIDRVFKFEEAPAAYQYLRSGQQRGKVVVEVRTSGAVSTSS